MPTIGGAVGSDAALTIAAAIAIAFALGGLVIFIAPVFGANKKTSVHLRSLFFAQVLIVAAVAVPTYVGGWVLTLALGIFLARGLFELADIFPTAKTPRSILIYIYYGVSAAFPTLLNLSQSNWHGLMWTGILLPFFWVHQTRQNRLELAISLVFFVTCIEAILFLAFQSNGFLLIVFVYFLVETFDAFAFICGSLWGRTKIFPRLSPNKTLEGYLGGFVAALGAGTLLNIFVYKFEPMKLITIMSVILIAGIFGDFLASLVKRRKGVKDFAALHSLHGGLLDIYDSYLAASLAFAGLILLMS
jgi:phosphatidate cytidylyltransferase